MRGGGKGLGFSLANKLVSVGAYVIITGRDERNLKQSVELLGNKKSSYFLWDVCDFDKAGKNIDVLCSKFGRINAFINNAGIYYPEDYSFLNQSQENWDNTFNTNLKGLHYLCQNEVKYFQTVGGGKIINITSIGGCIPGYTPYDLSKSAANILTKALAKRYTANKILINAIAPGEMPTDMGTPCDIHGNVFYKNQLNKRLTLTQDVAELASFLLSDAANNIVGQVICCDGGTSLR